MVCDIFYEEITGGLIFTVVNSDYLGSCDNKKNIKHELDLKRIYKSTSWSVLGMTLTELWPLFSVK